MKNEPQLVLATMDYTHGTTTLTRSDNKQAVFKTGFTGEPGTVIDRIQYCPQLRGVLISTTRGDEVAIPLALDGDPGPSPQVPVVYLDQNQWSLLSTVEAGQALPKADEEAAARQLIDWAKNRRIILPVSSGHCVETTEWTNTGRRYQLGLTLMRLSQGWQMRHPLDAQRDEIAAGLKTATDAPLPPGAIFSRAPATMTSTAEHTAYEPSSDLPPAIRDVTEALLHVSTTFDLLTHSSPIARQRKAAWRQVQQDLSDWLDQNCGSSEKKRHAIKKSFLVDITHGLALTAARTGLAPEEWPGSYEDRFLPNLSRLPYLGLRLEVMTGKHLNRGATWVDNDLIDMMYLCLAAGYADLVVCEKSAASHVWQAQKRLNRTRTAVSKLADGVQQLIALGVVSGV